MKRWLSLGLALLLAALALLPAHAEETVYLRELSGCKKVFAYSGASSAYFYGFHGSELVSARVLPGQMTRTVSAGGNILCVCHDDDHACALVKTGLHAFQALVLDMNSGAWQANPVAEGYTVQHTSVAYAQGEVMVIVVENGRSFVLGSRGSAPYSYRFSNNIDRLFVRDNAAYARLDGGRVYRLGAGASTLCSGVQPEVEGFSGGALTVSVNGSTAVLHSDFTCAVRRAAQAANGDVPSGEGKAGSPAAPAQPQKPDGEILTVRAGTTVAQLKQSRGDVTAVTDADGKAVSSGKLRTGYSAQLTGGSFPIAVTGDLDGSGTVTGRDVTALMQVFVGKRTLSACETRAADLNNDRLVDNRDLVLLAQTTA